HNHVMLLGDLIGWFYQDLAGIMAKQPGFKTLMMKPAMVDGLNSVNASYQTPYGLVKSSWANTSNIFTWNITVPANSSAWVYIPCKSAQNITEGGKNIATCRGVKYVRMENGRAIFRVGSGSYDFKAIN
ncbi:MAG: alpha-L-rhamnosidase C-terminal domain-containing protein, partial [Mucilaginibacter sp.]